MKKVKEYKISIVLFAISLVLFCVSMITGLIPGLAFSIDKISMYLGFSAFGLGLVLFEKNRENNSNNGNI